MSFIERLSRSVIVKTTLTLIVYGFYAGLLGLVLSPSVIFLVWGFRRLLLASILAGAMPPVGSMILLTLIAGAGVYIFYGCGLFVFSILIRVLSLFVKPGRYPAAAMVTLCWVVLNGIHTLALRLILPIVVLTPVSAMYWKIVGCRIGKNVWMNTHSLMDAYLITIEDDSVIGGDAVLSAHVFESGHLYLAPIHIGKGCMIGAHSYISPGVTVGDGAIVGMKAYIRKNRKIAPGARIAAMAGLPTHRLYELERGERR
jgi:hypothetical protein